VILLALVTSTVIHCPLEIEVVQPVITESLERRLFTKVGGAVAVILDPDDAGVEDAAST
jgi:hypothetical protein